MLSTRTQEILQALHRDLGARGIATGDRLPPERDLARQLGCSRDTLRKALAEMERAGDLWRHVGQGTFYGPRPFGHPVREAILVQGASPLQLMQARALIEPAVAAQAAHVATAPQVAVLARLVARGRHARSRSECEQIDAAFHRGIAEVTGNPILLGLLDYLAGVRRQAAWLREWERTYRRLGVAEFSGPHTCQHQTILDAIAQHDAQTALEGMRDHLETIFTAMHAATVAR